MTYILVEDFRGGLDTRKMAVTSPAGTLQELINAHITRGGEIEKAQAFQKVKDIEPFMTFGLLGTPNGFMVFGSEDLSAIYINNVINSNPPIRYQRLTAGSATMERVLSTELYDGKAYVIAGFDDGTIHHFYDTVEVTDWYSAQGRATFSITGGTSNEATAGQGSFKLTNGFIGDTVSAVTVDGVNLLTSTIIFNSGDTLQNLLSNIANNINANTGVSGYTASWVGNTITLNSVALGSGPNGDIVAVTATGTLTVSNIVNIAGGTDASQITSLKVNAVSIIDTSVVWSGSNSQTADALVAATRSYSATSGYTAYAYGQDVFIVKNVDGAGANGQAVDIVVTGAITITPSSGITIQNGAAGPSKYEPGRFAKTIDQKMYVLSNSVMHYSAIGLPTDFDSGTGSGFDNLATAASGSENLIALANYFENVAIFSRNNVHIWNVDADPDLNLQLQVLNNTGTIAAKSVIEFGDNDVFYLSESGIRSLRARDSSNAAFVNDVGVAIDSLIQAEIRADEEAAALAAGILEPRDSRYMLAIKDKLFVFSFFPTSKVSAWSKYEPGFVITEWAYKGQVVLCRSGDSIYRFGGAASQVYDASPVTVVLPFLDAGDPAAIKSWTGLDVACEGTWAIYASFNPQDPDNFTLMARITDSTFANENIPIEGTSSHISLKFVCESDEYARLGKVAIHYGMGVAN